MKKMIVSLLFSSSSLMFASKLDDSVSSVITSKALSICYVQIVVNFETPCGVYVYSQASPKYSYTCREGQAAGSTETYYEVRQLNGWNHGQGPDPSPSTCLN